MSLVDEQNFKLVYRQATGRHPVVLHSWDKEIGGQVKTVYKVAGYKDGVVFYSHGGLVVEDNGAAPRQVKDRQDLWHLQAHTIGDIINEDTKQYVADVTERVEQLLGMPLTYTASPKTEGWVEFNYTDRYRTNHLQWKLYNNKLFASNGPDTVQVERPYDLAVIL